MECGCVQTADVAFLGLKLPKTVMEYAQAAMKYIVISLDQNGNYRMLG